MQSHQWSRASAAPRERRAQHLDGRAPSRREQPAARASCTGPSQRSRQRRARAANKTQYKRQHRKAPQIQIARWRALDQDRSKSAASGPSASKTRSSPSRVATTRWWGGTARASPISLMPSSSVCWPLPIYLTRRAPTTAARRERRHGDVGLRRDHLRQLFRSVPIEGDDVTLRGGHRREEGRVLRPAATRDEATEMRRARACSRTPGSRGRTPTTSCNKVKCQRLCVARDEDRLASAEGGGRRGRLRDEASRSC